jgi:hypothetical protein
MLLIDNGFNSKQNIKRYEICLTRLESMNNSDYTSFEIIKQYYLGKIYLDVEKNYSKALNKFEILSKICPNNLIFRKIIEDCRKKVDLNYVTGPYRTVSHTLITMLKLNTDKKHKMEKRLA